MELELFDLGLFRTDRVNSGLRVSIIGASLTTLFAHMTYLQVIPLTGSYSNAIIIVLIYVYRA